MAGDGAYEEFIDQIGTFQKSLADVGVTAMADKMGKRAIALAEKAAAMDLGGDAKFSGWSPELETKYDHLDPGSISFHPTKTGAGPWRVADEGRNHGETGGFAGPGVNRKTGLTARSKTGKLRKVRATGGRRWNGATRGKGTAGQATDAIEAELPKVVEVELTRIVSQIF